MAVETAVPDSAGPSGLQIDICEELTFAPTEKESDTCFREEINVYSIPHSRMKRLAQMATDKLKDTNYSIASELLTTVKTLSRVFYEFKTHERIENECIMRRLQAKLIKLNIQNTAVCNCHKDDELSKMLKLFSEGIRCSTKSESERIKYGLKLEKELIKFQQHFLPHMQEEEDIFQPLLVQYFSVEELKELKESVLKQHQMWNSLGNLEEMVTQYEDNNPLKSHGTRSTSTSTSARSNKTWSGTSSSSLHITRLFDEKSAADIESLYYDSVDESRDPGCGFVASKSLVDEKIILDQRSGKSLPRGSSLPPPSSSRLHSPAKTGHDARLHSPAKTALSSPQKFPFINLLPSEVLAQIFTYLTIRDLCRVSQVCRQWNAVALDADLWLTLAPLAWISSLKDESTRGASWPNIETLETDSVASFPASFPAGAAEDADARQRPSESDDSDSTGKGSHLQAASTCSSSQTSDSAFKREQSVISSIAYRLVPRIGTRVSKLVLAGSSSITNVLLRRILHYIPNITYLDVRDTRIGDPAFKFVNRRDMKQGVENEVGHCFGRLQYLNLSGCVNFTDEGLRLLLATMDGALGRLENECEHSLCSTAEGRSCDNVSMKSGQTAFSDISSLHSRVEAQFQGLVITDDQVQQMRQQRQQRQQLPQQRRHQQQQQPRRRKSLSKTIPPLPPESDSNTSTTTKSWDLESSGNASLKSACVTCVECPVGDASTPDDGRPTTKTTPTSPRQNCCHTNNGEGNYDAQRQTKRITTTTTSFNGNLCHLNDEGGDAQDRRRTTTTTTKTTSSDQNCCRKNGDGSGDEVNTEAMSPPSISSSRHQPPSTMTVPPLLTRPLEYISLSGCYRLTDDGLLHLTRGTECVESGLPNLRHLDLSGCMNVSVEGLLPVLETCPLINFSHLFYCDNVFLGEGIDDLASGCRNLQRGSARVCCRSGL